MNKVLITGGAGFIGYHLAKRLSTENCQIDLVDNLSRGVLDSDIKSLTSNPSIRFINRDLLQRNSLNGLGNDYRYIYHFAAIIGVANVLDKPYAVLRDNMLILLNLLSFAKRQSTLKRFIFASTSEVYAGTLQYFTLPIPTPESSPLATIDLAHPRSAYMLSKIYGEALCHHSGVPFTIIRPHNIYGPRMGMAHVIPELLKKAHYSTDSDGLEVFSINHRRTFCYVTDAVEMIKRSAESDSCVIKKLNIGNESPELRIGGLAELILKVVGKNLKIIPKASTSGSPIRRCPDMSNTIRLTGYTSQVDLQKGIKSTYEWYRRNIFEGKEMCAR